MIKIDRPQFNPNWEARHELARERFDGLAPTASEPEREAALEALYQAHDAQFPTVAALAEFRFAHLRRSARRDGFMLAIKPLDPQAGEVDVEDAWRAAGRQIEAAKRARARRTLAQPDGLTAFSARRRPARAAKSCAWRRQHRAEGDRPGPPFLNAPGVRLMSASFSLSLDAGFMATSPG